MSAEKKLPDIPVDELDYDLPAEKIAFHPLPHRDGSKLLVFKEGGIVDDIYHNIAEHLPAGSLMVTNNTRVVQARLQFRTAQGKAIEVFCLEPADKSASLEQAMQSKGSVLWTCMIGDLRHWKEPVLQLITDDDTHKIRLSVRLSEREKSGFVVAFSWQPADLSFAEILHEVGKIPLPPYIKRPAAQEDTIRYQTVFARHDGSVAAPTAGLHYTPSVLASISAKGIHLDEVTLHVGAGTFKPVKSRNIADHEMHSEQMVVKKAFIQKLKDMQGAEVVAVGTTSMRTLESLYWLGLKVHKKLINKGEALLLEQWEPYQLVDDLPLYDALQALLDYLEQNGMLELVARTEVIIVPGYPWKVVTVLATNFHQPKSTLICLVAAFIGDDWRGIYQHALQNDYRFLSYGDGSLLFRKKDL